ncbi:tetratricopeptide repeat protein 31 isoform X2 [Myxocyprinus asiaticus]|uniref:tetratricopeptide repeat protein 31 isoform X2 n=1 Tax=Myxocyprinus asiaticus TaxID=70543 RepID=UPI002222F467|nr:tetratricopeptide repeat protein 31 isoform X2 [Myxocyprinus asiaticus]
MVGLMKFSLDICRLLGLSGSSDETPQEMDAGAIAEQNEDTLSQDVLIGEEGLSEDEKARRKAERRKAKRKRQRQRKKLEQVKKDECSEQNAGVESELEESEESEPEEVEENGLSKVEEKPVAPLSKSPAGPPLASANKSSQQPMTRSSEEDPEWDVNSAFVANAVSHIRPKAKSKGAHKSKENKENESRTGEVTGEVIGLVDAVTKRSALLVEKGIRYVQEGQYSHALSLFTEAIKCDPKDYRFFGNRSYCYCCLEQYPLALADAEKSIQMAPDWPKGYYRRGSALMGLKRYSEAEKAMEQVLKLDRDCEEAVNDLLYCKVQQLTDLRYDEEQSIQLLEKYSTVQAVVAARASNQDCAFLQPGPCSSLWVGNVSTELTEKHLRDLFKIYGEIDSIRVLHERFCAFVNFKNANMASRAMEKLNGHLIENTRLVVRYPDRRIQRALPTPAIQQSGYAGPRRRGPVNGDECYFWRTSGCHFGDRCRYKHIPDHRGKDWQP